MMDFLRPNTIVEANVALNPSFDACSSLVIPATSDPFLSASWLYFLHCHGQL